MSHYSRLFAVLIILFICSMIVHELQASVFSETAIPASGDRGQDGTRIFGMKPGRFIFVALTILFHLYIIPRTIIRLIRHIKKKRQEKQNHL